jgi:hypothetical protein
MVWGTLVLALLALGLWAPSGLLQAASRQSTVPPPPTRVGQGLLALYLFDEGNGAIVKDSSGVGDPLDLFLFDGTAAIWGDGYLKVKSPTIIASAFPATKIVDAAKASNEITIEAWVKPKKADQEGPARIVTLSSDPNNRNFTLGQTEKNHRGRFDVRLRTTATSENGMPSVDTEAGTVTTELIHVLYTRNSAGIVTLYINGTPREIETRGGNLSNWDSSFRLALANELTHNRPWLGEFHLVALYGRALSAADAQRNFKAGPNGETDNTPTPPTPTPIPGERVSAGLQALYTFEEGSGSIIHDVSEAGSPLDLYAFNGAAVTWGSGWLTVDQRTIVSSAFPASKINQAVKESNELTVEAWIRPENNYQDGPARIVSLSSDPHHRNFTLGQRDHARYDMRLRTTTTSESGIPSLSTARHVVTTDLTHVVYTRNAAGLATIYIDGMPVAVETIKGKLSNWSPFYRLALANEQTLNRPWLGSYHLVAIYSRALDSAEVAQNFNAGTRDGESATPNPPPVEGSPAIQGSVTINRGPTTSQGAIHSTSPTVMLALQATSTAGKISQMRTGADANALGQWVNYSDKSAATLPAPGEQRIFAQFRDSVGNVSTVYSDTILLDESKGSDFGITINDGAQWTNTTEVMLTLPAEAKTAEMQVSNDGGFIGVAWEPYTLYKPWTVISYGTQLIQPVVYVRYRSTEGATTSVYQDDIILDLQAPSSQVTQAGLGVAALSEDDPVVPVAVTWAGDDDLSGIRWHDVQVRIGDGEWTDWLVQTPESSAIYEALPGAEYSFRVRSEDNAGNWSDYSDGGGVQTILVPGEPAAEYPIFLPSVSRN